MKKAKEKESRAGHLSIIPCFPPCKPSNKRRKKSIKKVIRDAEKAAKEFRRQI